MPPFSWARCHRHHHRRQKVLDLLLGYTQYHYRLQIIYSACAIKNRSMLGFSPPLTFAGHIQTSQSSVSPLSSLSFSVLRVRSQCWSYSGSGIFTPFLFLNLNSRICISLSSTPKPLEKRSSQNLPRCSLKLFV